ncbi:MAG TPA: SPASM domain-containing protein, partial [Bacteroidetes bacterium]|nr:SPASM domain-containing protein [Bacteroidota bacterium]
SAEKEAEKFRDKGFKVERTTIENRNYTCYADVISQAVITPDGRVFKCTARDFVNTKPDGFLIDDGTIEWSSIFYDRVGNTTIREQECYNCKFLSACWGPCSQKLLELKEGEFDKICNINGIEKTIQTMMTNFYSENIQGNQI